MYLEHFGLGVNPFSLSPKLDFLYKSGTFEESMAHLVYGLDNHEAIVLITGAIGTGKTMALQSFLTSLGPRFEFALITNTRVTAIELLKLVLEDLGIGLPIGADKSDLLILFKDYLHAASREGKMVLLVVDEAQNLAPEVLEEIRLLTNLGQGEAQPVQIILVGQPELDETVNRPDLAQIRQRIRVHYKLDPLSREETEEYINHRMAVAGCGRNVFTSGAVDRIFKASRGVPRLVNTMAGEALLSAFVAGHEMVQPVDIDEGQELRFNTGPAPVQVAAPPVPPPVVPQPVVAAQPSPPPVVPQPVVVASPPPLPAQVTAPLPVPEPVQQERGPQIQPPESSFHDRRRPRDSGSQAWRPWLIVVAVVLALWALYYFGAVDSLVGAFNSITARSTGPVLVQDSAVAAQQPQESTVELPADSGTDQINDSDSVPTIDLVQNPVQKQEVIQEKSQEIIPEEQPAALPLVQIEEQAEVLDPAVADNQTPALESANTGEGDIFIHIYSFRTPERADDFVRHWEYPADSFSVIVQEVRDVTWHRIYLGPFLTREDALMVALRLKENETIDYFKVVSHPPNHGS